MTATAAPQSAATPAPAAPPSAPAPKRVKVVILNQFYVPDVASTGKLLHELATELARQNFDVTVTASWPSYGPPETRQKCPFKEEKDGVKIRRFRTTRLSKDRMIGRAMNAATFFIPMFLRVLFLSRRDAVYMYVTNPPFLGIVGAIVSFIRRHRYVIMVQDSYPHIATWTGKIRKGGLIERLWHRCNRISYRRAARVVVICQASRKLLIDDYGLDGSKVTVLYNWAHEELLKPREKRDTDFAREHGLIEPFTVMYSGNLGIYYEFETLLDAAERLMNDSFRLVLVGAGGRRNWLAEQIDKRKLTNTLLLPYQPYEKLGDSLAACDASLVTIAKGIEGISFPSKIYSTIAVAKPVILLAEKHSELRDLVKDFDCGRWFEVGNPEALADGMRQMMKEPARLKEMGINGRALFDREYTLEAAGKRYSQMLREVADTR